MQIVRFDSAPNYEPEKDWRRVSLCDQSDISIEHFTKPPRHASPRHDHANAQVLVVIQGRLSVATDTDGEVTLEPGDAAYIPSGEPHVVTNPLEVASVGIDIFVPGRDFDFWLKRGPS
ncbi:MAG: cupin domain-containing protein [Desulfobacterales bacterium]